MFPVLFRVGNIPVNSYYVIWFTALILALRWSVSRMALYEIDDDEGRRVIAFGFLGMICGARGAEIIRDLAAYWSDPSLIFDFNRGGLSEKGAIIGALIVIVTLCLYRRRVSFFKLCEAVVLPGFLVIALGRWGCFFAGCCIGVESTFPLAVHFPGDLSYVTRHATQIYYSIWAALSLLTLCLAEKRLLKRGRLPVYPVLTPLGIILYSAMRLAVDTLRLDHRGAVLSDVVLMVMIPLGAALFLFSLSSFGKRNASSD